MHDKSFPLKDKESDIGTLNLSFNIGDITNISSKTDPSTISNQNIGNSKLFQVYKGITK